MKTSQTLSALALATTFAHAGLLAKRGIAGTTTRYWDCCKASCSWSNKAACSAPVSTCDMNDNPFSSHDATSGCDANGSAFMCSSQQPFAIDDNLAYGFAAITGSGSEADTCCACYKLTFTSQITGKVMIVQATNIGYDVQNTQFDLALPGGGVGAFPQGCQRQYNAPAQGWGTDPGRPYGGVASRAECGTLPTKLQAGCQFRFDWLQGANNPSMSYERVACPAKLLARSSCKRNDDGKYPAAPVGGSTSPSSSTTTSWVPTTTTTPRPRTTTTSTRPTTTTSPASGGGTGTAARYGQCGGVNWTGPKRCEAGTTCQKQNGYYWQCL